MREPTAKLTADYAATKLRILEIEATLAEMKRAYIVDGIDGDYRLRSELGAELAALSLTRYKQRVELYQRKVGVTTVKTHSFLHLLVAKVEAAGFHHLITEAQEESLAAIQAMGLHADYLLAGVEP